MHFSFGIWKAVKRRWRDFYMWKNFRKQLFIFFFDHTCQYSVVIPDPVLRTLSLWFSATVLYVRDWTNVSCMQHNALSAKELPQFQLLFILTSIFLPKSFFYTCQILDNIWNQADLKSIWHNILWLLKLGEETDHWLYILFIVSGATF